MHYVLTVGTIIIGMAKRKGASARGEYMFLDLKNTEAIFSLNSIDLLCLLVA